VERNSGGDLSQSPPVVEGDSQGLSLANTCVGSLELATRVECRPQRKPQIDGLLTRGIGLRQMSESKKCLLEV